MSDLNSVLETIKEIKDSQDKLSTRLDEVAKTANSDRKDGPAPVARVRTGEDPLSSRGFSFAKLFGVMANRLDQTQAKVELDIVHRLNKLHDTQGFRKEMPNSVMVPFSSQLMAQASTADESLAREVGEVVRAGVVGYDREEVAALRAKYWGVQKALSWTSEVDGGALVGPPVMGELIDLLRPNQALMAAGARVLAMPPNGRITFPRQTGASTAYWIGESQQITDTQPTTGDVVLQAKKLGVVVKIPNELFRFASISIEQFVREDIAKQVGLKLDKDLLEAPGSSVQPKGLINYSGIQTHTVTSNVFQPEDVAKMIAKVEEKNAVFKAWIMRPLMWAAIMNRRADAVSGGDSKGLFMFSPLRDASMNPGVDRNSVGSLGGYPAHKSTNVSNTRGSGSQTYILGGDFSDLLIAMSGSMEFQVSTQGDTPFQYDQTWFRGILYCDSAPRHEASFVFADAVNLA